MRTISKGSGWFHGTHKGYTIEIDAEPDRELRAAGRKFYIRVFNDYGHAYDGWSNEGVDTIAQAKREALYGACLKPRPAENGASIPSEASASAPAPDEPLQPTPQGSDAILSALAVGGISSVAESGGSPPAAAKSDSDGGH